MKKAKVKSTGEIIVVQPCMDCEGNTTWLEGATNTEYYPSELELFDEQRIVPPEDVLGFEPLQMTYDSQTQTARLFQDFHIRITQEIVNVALRVASDKQLREELKRRANKRKALKMHILRCRDCKHCTQGYTHARGSWRGEQTTICSLKPKLKAGHDCYYATSLSNKACENFEPK